MSNLEDFFYNQHHKLIHKWSHYFDIYDRHFTHLRGRKINILEIGIAHGGSLEMWCNYFGSQVTIYALDINPDCKKFENDYTKIFIGSQGDKKFLSDLCCKLPELDIIIDDGGHRMKQQLTSFNILFPKLGSDGIYLCEDTHTSFIRGFGSRRITFAKMTKKLIDSFQSWHSRFHPEEFNSEIDSIHYYDGIIIIEKKKRIAPHDVKRGYISIKDPEAYDLLVKNRSK